MIPQPNTRLYQAMVRPARPTHAHLLVERRKWTPSGAILESKPSSGAWRIVASDKRTVTLEYPIAGRQVTRLRTQVVLAKDIAA